MTGAGVLAGATTPNQDETSKPGSPDSPAKQKKFDDKYGLGFPLLSDEDHVVSKAYKVWKKKSMYGREYMGIERSAFLIQDGVILEAWYKVSATDTPLRANTCSWRFFARS